MDKKRLILVLLITFFVVLIGLGIIGFLHRIRPYVYIFDDVSGPAAPTAIPAPDLAPLNAYSQGSVSRLAILLTDAESPWLGLAHALKSWGIPFLITEDYQQALKHRVVLVYPIISGKVLEPEALKALAAFPRQGGALLGVNVYGGGLNEVFGFQEAVTSRQRSKIIFDRSQPIVSELSDPREQELPVSAGERAGSQSLTESESQTGFSAYSALGTLGYTDPDYPPLALFDDGTAAVTQKPYAAGAAYAFGIDLGFLILKGHNYREEGLSRSYVNEYEPTLDVLIGLVRDLYLEAEPYGLILSPVPSGRSLAVMITHDVDTPLSLLNSLDYADFERQAGIRATYFIQTKYIRDWNDEIFFNAKFVKVIQALEDRGMEIGSHSVSHAELFSDFPLGDGKESYPEYRPFVQRRRQTVDGSLLGELRVSKFLLDHFLRREEVVSFRPGFLSNPFALPQALIATGFLYTSTITANKSLTHLPFQLNYNRDFQAETGMFEFPVTVEDEHLPRMGDRLPQAIALAEKISRHGGIYVVLIHPDILGHKLGFERGFIQAVRDFSWFGSLSDFGNWWKARNRVEWDLIHDRDRIVAELNIPERLLGLTLRIPESLAFVSSGPENLSVTMSENGLVLGDVQGKIQLIFEAR